MAALSNSGRYCMYLRKSRADEMKEQLGEFETLSRHQDELYALADRLGIKVSKVFREIVSGESIDERPEMIKLIDEVRQNQWDGVLAFEIERLSRGDATDQGTVGRAFMYSNTLIITPMKIYDPLVDSDMEYFEFGLFMSRREYKTISRRLQSGRRKSAKEGQYLGSIAPFGWRKIDIDGKHTIEPNEETIPWLKFIFEEIASWRMQPTGLANYLNRAGIPTPRNKYWDKKTITNIVRNPIHKGYVRWANQKTVTELDEDMRKVKRRVANDETDPDKSTLIVKGLHDGVISDELWEQANHQLDIHALPSTRKGKPLRNPLAGLLVCSECGRAIGRCISKFNGIESYDYRHPTRNRHVCFMSSTRCDDVFEAVIDALIHVSNNLECSISSDTENPKSRIAQVLDSYRKELASLANGIENVFRLAEKGLITDEEFAERKTKLDVDRKEIQKHIDDLMEQNIDAGDVEKKIIGIHEAIESLKNYEGREKQVNDLLKSLIEKIEYTRRSRDEEFTLNIILR